MSDSPPRTRIIPRSSAEQIARVGLRNPWWRDLYHRALTVRWWWFVLYGSLAYVAVNVVFAVLYMLQPGSIAGARPGSLLDAFFFSVQCLSTIGFGQLTPATLYANVLTVLEAIVSLAITALATGSVFARISRPRARVMFARSAVVGTYNGQLTLTFRMGNERVSQILEATVAVSLLRYERTAEGDVFRRFYDLKLARSHTPVFSLTFSVMHPIDEDSPLYGRTKAELLAEEVDILVTVTGLEETTSQTVHARHAYSADEIFWDRRYVDIFNFDASGKRYIDYGRFHDTVPHPVA